MNEIQKQLSAAIASETIEEVRSLLEKGADANGVDDLGWTPLMNAAEAENIEILKLLLEHGADINKKNEAGETPLHIAVDIAIDGAHQVGGAPGDEPIESIVFLLEQGAAIDARNVKGETPLDWARNYGSKKVIRVLEPE
jgi:ankyrin repeat protein